MAINFPATPADGDTHEGYVWVAAENAWRRLPEAPAMDIENLNNVSVTSPADGESLVYDSTAGEWVNADATVDVYDVDTLSTGYFMIPTGGDGNRPATSLNGYIRFNTDSGFPEWYSEESGSWIGFNQSPSFEVNYLVVAGGGSGGGGGGNTYAGGGGGAGGYRSSILGESSGGGSSAETSLNVLTDQSFAVTIGAGGSGGNTGWTDGNNSVFGSITSIYGTKGGGTGVNVSGLTGGSGGGGSAGSAGASGTVSQGFSGGVGASGGGIEPGGGGGGAAQAGENANTDGSGYGGDGGLGIDSFVTGSSVGRAGGGGGGASSGGTAGSATDGAGAGGAANQNGTSASANTGGGGGGCGYHGSGSSRSGGNGGSGIVIVKYPLDKNISIGPGLTASTSVVGSNKVTVFTAGTDSVTFS